MVRFAACEAIVILESFFNQLGVDPLVSRTWRDRLLGASTGATLTLVALWLVLVSAAAAAVILRA